MGGILAEYLGMDTAFYAMGVLNAVAFLGVTLFLPEIAREKKDTVAELSFR